MASFTFNVDDDDDDDDNDVKIFVCVFVGVHAGRAPHFFPRQQPPADGPIRSERINCEHNAGNPLLRLLLAV